MEIRAAVLYWSCIHFSFYLAFMYFFIYAMLS